MLRPPILEHIVRQHAEMAAFLWTVYDHHLLHPGENPEVDEERVERLIERLEAHLLGLRIAGVDGKRIAKERFDEFSEAGELFVIRMLEATSPLPLKQLNLEQVRKYLTAKLPVAGI
ncbi:MULTISPECIES: hypothetical protein [unclassified Mesorhizobium]|uniref:hypothetical protein n=1 Tax=unclassified Mesorhizobium TaxID=325217 RepID=UPI000FD2091A|nr:MULTISPECIES: hypothetical protein [unclassified Mesorhizobium]RVB77985.1 hypothetical protein EN885_11740 [Mesorhizobium sp. M6A.T.Cr.TU.014.01.1.1]RWQ07964.1 MAG: hypothetical protein EOR90_11045 [Mesorhizobium sp.]RWQ09018.1 MAG: hypothetical protein EOR91_10185 [Mesorhizobium sp.]